MPRTEEGDWGNLCRSKGIQQSAPFCTIWDHFIGFVPLFGSGFHLVNTSTARQLAKLLVRISPSFTRTCKKHKKKKKKKKKIPHICGSKLIVQIVQRKPRRGREEANVYFSWICRTSTKAATRRRRKHSFFSFSFFLLILTAFTSFINFFQLYFN
jgi:hypothetical protein